MNRKIYHFEAPLVAIKHVHNFKVFRLMIFRLEISKLISILNILGFSLFWFFLFTGFHGSFTKSVSSVILKLTEYGNYKENSLKVSEFLNLFLKFWYENSRGQFILYTLPQQISICVSILYDLMSDLNSIPAYRYIENWKRINFPKQAKFSVFKHTTPSRTTVGELSFIILRSRECYLSKMLK